MCFCRTRRLPCVQRRRFEGPQKPTCGHVGIYCNILRVWFPSVSGPSLLRFHFHTEPVWLAARWRLSVLGSASITWNQLRMPAPMLLQTTSSRLWLSWGHGFPFWTSYQHTWGRTIWSHCLTLSSRCSLCSHRMSAGAAWIKESKNCGKTLGAQSGKSLTFGWNSWFPALNVQSERWSNLRVAFLCLAACCLTSWPTQLSSLESAVRTLIRMIVWPGISTVLFTKSQSWCMTNSAWAQRRTNLFPQRRRNLF